MSGFPGQHGYSEFASQLTRRDREALRLDVPPVERSADIPDVLDALALRVALMKCTKADMVTDREWEKAREAIETAIEIIQERDHEIHQLRQQARKAGTSEGK